MPRWGRRHISDALRQVLSSNIIFNSLLWKRYGLLYVNWLTCIHLYILSSLPWCQTVEFKCPFFAIYFSRGPQDTIWIHYIWDPFHTGSMGTWSKLHKNAFCSGETNNYENRSQFCTDHESLWYANTFANFFAKYWPLHSGLNWFNRGHLNEEDLIQLEA